MNVTTQNSKYPATRNKNYKDDIDEIYFPVGNIILKDHSDGRTLYGWFKNSNIFSSSCDVSTNVGCMNSTLLVSHPLLYHKNPTC